MHLIDKLSDLKGRLIAYLGGSGIFAYSSNATAKAKEIVQSAHDAAVSQSNNLMSVHITSYMTVADLLAVVGAVVVFGRFVLDVVKYIRPVRTRDDSN